MYLYFRNLRPRSNTHSSSGGSHFEPFDRTTARYFCDYSIRGPLILTLLLFKAKAIKDLLYAVSPSRQYIQKIKLKTWVSLSRLAFFLSALLIFSQEGPLAVIVFLPSPAASLNFTNNTSAEDAVQEFKRQTDRRMGLRVFFRMTSHIVADQVVVILGIWAMIVSHMLRNICEELDRETSNVNENVHNYYAGPDAS